MSNFGDWRKPGAAEAFEQAQLAKRLANQEAKVYHVSTDGAISDMGIINAKPARLIPFTNTSLDGAVYCPTKDEVKLFKL